MKRILIFGNSGSGKTTMARDLVLRNELAHLDLDLLAWETPGERRPISASAELIRSFIRTHPEWVIEGCYGDLIELAVPDCSELRFLNPGVEACVRHCRSRRWEPEKYASAEEQDARLDFLIEWVRSYESRSDEFSLQRHRAIFDAFTGAKFELTSTIAWPSGKRHLPENGEASVPSSRDPMTIEQAESEEQIAATYDVMCQLRPHIARAEYLPLVRSLMADEGYRLAALLDDGEVRAAAGYRFLTTLHRGRILFLDDLVTHQQHRSNGYGKRMIAWLREEGRSLECQEIQLISRVVREQAHRFYFREGFGIECFHFRAEL